MGRFFIGGESSRRRHSLGVCPESLSHLHWIASGVRDQLHTDHRVFDPIIDGVGKPAQKHMADVSINGSVSCRVIRESAENVPQFGAESRAQVRIDAGVEFLNITRIMDNLRDNPEPVLHSC